MPSLLVSWQDMCVNVIVGESLDVQVTIYLPEHTKSTTSNITRYRHNRLKAKIKT